MLSRLAALALAVLLAGCSHTRVRPLDASRADVRDDVNRRDDAVVVLTTGERIRASTLRLDAREVSWVDAETGEARTAPLGAVHDVTVRNRRSFVLRDLGIGALAGAATGFALGSLSDSNVVFSRGHIQAMAAVAGLGVGTAAGALVGYEEGRTAYTARPPESATGSARSPRSSAEG